MMPWFCESWRQWACMGSSMLRKEFIEVEAWKKEQMWDRRREGGGRSSQKKYYEINERSGAFSCPYFARGNYIILTTFKGSLHRSLRNNILMNVSLLWKIQNNWPVKSSLRDELGSLSSSLKILLSVYCAAGIRHWEHRDKKRHSFFSWIAYCRTEAFKKLILKYFLMKTYI